MAVSLYISVGESSTIRMRAMVFPYGGLRHRPSGRTSRCLFHRGEVWDVGLDGTEQLFLTERFGEVLIGTHDTTFGLIEQTVLGGQHDYRGGLESTVIFDQGAGLIAI